MLARYLPHALLVALLACSRDTAPRRDARMAVRDSLRVRRERAFELRPDTFGARVDSQRIAWGAGREPRTWVIVMSDFQCEACQRFALDVMPALRRDLSEGARFNLAFVNAPRESHFNARFAALAALCAGSAGRFWDMHDSLFATRVRWERAPDPRAYMDSLAVRAGVPAATQADCTGRNRLLRLLEGDLVRSERLRADDLPAVFVGDRRLPPGARTVAGVRQAISAATPAR